MKLSKNYLKTWTKIFSAILLITFTFLHSDETLPTTPKIRMFLFTDIFNGELEFAKRIQISCRNLDWDCDIADITKEDNDTRLYDWNFTLVPFRASLQNQPDYIMLFDPIHHYFNTDGHLNETFKSFSGYLATYTNIDLLFEDVGESRVYNKPWYPTVQYRPYQVVKPDHLFYIIAGWGNRRLHPKYISLQDKLSKKSYTDLYGDPNMGKRYKKAYRGKIPFDGETILDQISKSGVCLVLHSETHLEYQIPSGRIFEAAAASAVIISDNNQFVIDNFGDSVLYVDQRLSASDMFKQIDRHMSWIKNNKHKALELARRSHQIFEDRFLLENQLLDFEHYHRQLNQQE